MKVRILGFFSGLKKIFLKKRSEISKNSKIFSQFKKKIFLKKFYFSKFFKFRIFSFEVKRKPKNSPIPFQKTSLFLYYFSKKKKQFFKREQQLFRRAQQKEETRDEFSGKIKLGKRKNCGEKGEGIFGSSIESNKNFVCMKSF